MENQPSNQAPSEPTTPKKKRGLRLTMLLRRIHLYAGLFLLPWVFLYGLTGAMFNHQGLLPEATMQTIDPVLLADTDFQNSPSPQNTAQQVIAALEKAAPESKIRLDESHSPQWTNDVMFYVTESGKKHAVHFDPVDKSAWVATFPEHVEKREPLLKDVRNVKIKTNPYEIARSTVPKVLSSLGINTDQKPKPLGWSKLNFIASVDGVPARVTYVARDGHVDITKHDGNDGISFRHFFLRLHTSHGQPPHWNGRMVWSLFVDTMAIAMLTWGITGLVMWWQIKRTRLIGGVVIGLSVATAAMVYISMLHFYATTKL